MITGIVLAVHGDFELMKVRSEKAVCSGAMFMDGKN